MGFVSGRRVGRAVVASAGALLFFSLFLPWSGHGRGNFLVLFGAQRRLGGFFENLQQDAWQVYSVADVALAAVAVCLILVAVVDTARAAIVGAVVTALALVFRVVELFAPPAVALPASVPPGMARFAARFGFTSGAIHAGEIVAAVSLVVALSGLVAARPPRAD